jgi:hypothetical protein
MIILIDRLRGSYCIGSWIYQSVIILSHLMWMKIVYAVMKVCVLVVNKCGITLLLAIAWLILRYFYTRKQLNQGFLEWGKDREVFMTSGTYPWSFVTQIFHSGQPSHAGDRTIQELLILPEHLSSPLVFSGVRVTRSLALYVCCVVRCLSFCTFFFWPLWTCPNDKAEILLKVALNTINQSINHSQLEKHSKS